MVANDTKRERERRIIEHARARSGFFPPGELEISDRPDGRIESAKLGIEVSELLPKKRTGAIFGGAQLARFQAEVVEKASVQFRSTHICPSDVLVYFKNDWKSKGNAEQMAQALADFVCMNYPVGSETVCLQQGSSAVGWIEGLSVVRISAHEGRWQTSGNNDRTVLTYELLASRIAAKSSRIEEYRRQLPGWEIWLLLVSHISVLWSVSTPQEIGSWSFISGFDRILFSSWDMGVLELNCHRDNDVLDLVKLANYRTL